MLVLVWIISIHLHWLVTMHRMYDTILPRASFSVQGAPIIVFVYGRWVVFNRYGTIIRYRQNGIIVVGFVGRESRGGVIAYMVNVIISCYGR